MTVSLHPGPTSAFQKIIRIFTPPKKKKNRHAGQLPPAVLGRGDSLRVTEQCRELSWFWFLKLKRVELRCCSSYPPSEVAAMSSEPRWHGTS